VAQEHQAKDLVEVLVQVVHLGLVLEVAVQQKLDKRMQITNMEVVEVTAFLRLFLALTLHMQVVAAVVVATFMLHRL
jgi:hypothetical protein